MSKLQILLVLCVVVVTVQCASSDEWRSRTIYQLLTDRFALTNGSTSPCPNISGYCGGTFQGIIENLDYIQGMGFDAIWISPVVKNYPGGYHGYWMTDLYSINPHFGTEQDLINLVKACHQKGIWVMVDVVANHVGPVSSVSSIVPFNQASHYHDCSPCPSNCQIQDWNDQPQIEWCRLAGLPDLAQENSYVATTLQQWIKGLVSNYSFDGIRIDTIPEVPKSFWTEFVAAADMYAVGEVYNGDVGYVAGYMQPTGPLPAVLSYPLFFTLRGVFAYQQSMWNLQSINQQYSSSISELGLLGTFIDNHDQQRFLNQQPDVQLYKNAIVYTLMSEGIPIIYYGSEQGFNGASDPNNREPLWTSKFNTNAPLYQFIATVNQYRQKAQIWQDPQIQRYADDNFYAFTRGNTFVAMTNGGSKQSGVLVTITYHPYSNGQKLCNLFYPTTDCFTVTNNQFDVYLENGECKIYYPV